jgi:protein-disulfide isomerase
MSPKSNPKPQSVRAQRAAKRQKQRKVVVGFVIGGILLLVFLFALPSIIEAALPLGEITVPEAKIRPQVDFNTMGDPNAPVKIVEYSDFQCPFCKRFSDEVEMELVENYVKPGKVFFVYIPYGPGGNYIGPESKASANAAFCAAEQGKFWEYKDFLFANHTGENVGDFTNKRLIAFADNLGLDLDQFKKCLTDEKFNDLLEEGITQGRASGVGGTPHFIFNDGEATLLGAQPYSKFVETIEGLLNE